MIIRANVCVSDIEKARIFTSEKTGKKYLSLLLMDYREGPDSYENDGSISHSVSEEERKSGTKGAFCGSWRYVVRPNATPASKPPAPKPPKAAATPAEDDDIPF